MLPFFKHPIFPPSSDFWIYSVYIVEFLAYSDEINLYFFLLHCPADRPKDTWRFGASITVTYTFMRAADMHLPTSPCLSLCFSLACNASLPSVLLLHCAARRRHGRRHGAIVMAILQYQYPDTATKRQQPMPHHSTPLTPLLSFSLSPSLSILTQSIPLSLTKYVRIDSPSVPCSSSIPLSFFLSFLLFKIYQISSPPSDHLMCLSFPLHLSFHCPSFTPSCSPWHPPPPPPPLHVFFFLSIFFFVSVSLTLCILIGAYELRRSRQSKRWGRVMMWLYQTQYTIHKYTHSLVYWRDTDTLACADSRRCSWVNTKSPLQNHPHHTNPTKQGLRSRQKHLQASNSRNDTESHIQRFSSFWGLK